MPLHSSKVKTTLVISFDFLDLLQASTDQSTVDTNMQYQVAAFSFYMIQLLGIIAVMSQVAWQVFIIFVPVIATCVWYQVMLVASIHVFPRLTYGF